MPLAHGLRGIGTFGKGHDGLVNHRCAFQSLLAGGLGWDVMPDRL